jgi:hypothetical protein
MPIRSRKGVVLYNSQHKNKNKNKNILILIQVSDIRRWLFLLENLNLRGHSGTQIWKIAKEH